MAQRTFSLTLKLFLAFFVLCAATAIAVTFAVRQSFQSGFTGYLDEQEQVRLVAFADALHEEYLARQGWQFVDSERAWRRLVDRRFRLQSRGGKKLTEGEAALQVWNTITLRSNLGLVDADRKTVLAGAPPGPSALWQPVGEDAEPVGWLTRNPQPSIADVAERRFHDRQMQAIRFIALLSLLPAALLSIFFARKFLAPVRHIVGVVERLAGGDLGVRVRIDSRDELRQLGLRINLLAETLERNESSRRTFMAEVAHDLRTPLAILRGEIEAIEDGVRQPTPEAIASLRTETDMLTRLVDDIHTLSLADVGRLTYTMQPTDLGVCARSALDAFREAFAQRRLRVEVDGVHALPVCADPARLAQMFFNIFRNSMLYTHEGGRVRLVCSRAAGQAVIDVMDSEPGVPEDQLDSLFERFVTHDAARSRSRSGSGLGLAICRSLVEGHGGVIRATASPLGGVWIQVRLPLNGSGSPQADAARGEPV